MFLVVWCVLLCMNSLDSFVSSAILPNGSGSLPNGSLLLSSSCASLISARPVFHHGMLSKFPFTLPHHRVKTSPLFLFMSQGLALLPEGEMRDQD